MLWALIIISLVAAFGGKGPGSIFVVEDVKKEIKRTVTDPDRKKQLLDLTKSKQKEIKKFYKSYGKLVKQARKIASDQEGDTAALKAIFKEAYDLRIESQDKVIDGFLGFQALCTEEEWADIIDVALEPTTKQQKKLDKKDNKAKEADEKPVERFGEEIKAAIADDTRREEVMDAFRVFKAEIIDLRERVRGMDVNSEETLRKYGATREELEVLREELNESRKEVAHDFLELRAKLVATCTEDEWTSIRKSIRKLFQ